MQNTGILPDRTEDEQTAIALMLAGIAHATPQVHNPSAALIPRHQQRTATGPYIQSMQPISRPMPLRPTEIRQPIYLAPPPPRPRPMQPATMSPMVGQPQLIGQHWTPCKPVILLDLRTKEWAMAPGKFCRRAESVYILLTSFATRRDTVDSLGRASTLLCSR